MRTKGEKLKLINEILSGYGLIASKIKLTEKFIFIETPFSEEDNFNYLKPLHRKLDRCLGNCLTFEVFHSQDMELTIKISLI